LIYSLYSICFYSVKHLQVIDISSFFFKGDKGIFTIRQGLSVVYISGLEEKENKKFNDERVTFNLKDIESLETNCIKKFGDCVDLFLTNQWPKGVEKLSNQQLVN
jgi:hypothetical protein